MPADSNRPHILMLGVNHKTAPVEVRECLALRESEIAPLSLLSGLPHCDEVVFLSTCNRVEVLVATRKPAEALKHLTEFWTSRGPVGPVEIRDSLYIYQGTEAVRHLFRVASSLDSMVVGEPQILGQLKEAYRRAADAHTTGFVLNRALHKAFSVAKKIRTETRIANSAVSISYAAVELAKKIFGDLAGKNAMLIGAGEMAELAAQHLNANGIKSLVVANRTLARAVELTRLLGGSAIGMDELEDALRDVDIVISSTGAPGIILDKNQIRRVMPLRHHRLLFFIDIAVPRDIDPAINDVDNVYLYDIDDLKGVVELNKAEREKEANKAERMIEAEVIKFVQWMECLDVVPIIRQLQDKAEDLRQRELARSRKALGELTPAQEKAVEVLTRSIAQKLLHGPVTFLRKGATEDDFAAALDLTTRLFGINQIEEDGVPPGPSAEADRPGGEGRRA